MKMTCLLLAAAAVAAMAYGADASGTEVKGVIQTQAVTPGDYMNPAFTGSVDVNIHFPTTRNANTGLMVVLHGLGSHFHRYDTECETWVNEYNVFTVQVNYRGTGQPPPGYDFGKYQAIDVLRVVQYMMGKYPLNKKRIFLWGASGGGHVALQTAKMAPGTFALVAALSPITRPTDKDDRTLRNYEADPTGGWEAFILGTGRTYTQEEWDIRDAQYLALFLKDVPVYLLHGDADPVVDWQHSKDLHAALKTAGGNATLITIKDGDHDFNGARDPTENTRFKATQKHLKAPILTVTAPGDLEQDLQAKITFPTRGGSAWPVKFDVQGFAKLDRIVKPGAIASLRLHTRTVKHGEDLRFQLKVENWTGLPQNTVILAGFFQLSNSSVLPLFGPAPFLLPGTGVEGPVAIPISKAFPAEDYLFVVVVVGSSPASYIDLDFFQFTTTSGS